MTNPPPINLGGRQGARSLYQFTLQDTDTAELYQWAPMLEEKMRELPRLEDVSSDLQLKNPQITRRHGPRQDRHARPDRRTRSRPRCTTPTAPGRSRRSTRRTTSIRSCCRSRRSSSGIRRRCRCLYVRSNTGAADSARHRSPRRDDRRRTAGGQPHRPAAVGDALVQPEAGRRARRRGRRGRSSSQPRRCRRRSTTSSRARRRRSRTRCRASA